LHGNNRTVNMQNLPAGQYIVNIFSEIGVIPIKVVKQ